MPPRNKFRYTLTTILLACFGACSEAGNGGATTTECSPGVLRSECLLADVEKILQAVDDVSVRTSVATEYAVALAADGDQQRALAVLSDTGERVGTAVDLEQRASLLADLVLAYHNIDAATDGSGALAAGRASMAHLDAEGKRLDLYAKFSVGEAYMGNVDQALDALLSFPDPADESLLSYQARGLRELSSYQARLGDFESAKRTLSSITMGLTYYRSVAHSDVASSAFAAGQTSLATDLLDEAISIADSIDDGYFKAGALRDIGAAHLAGDDNGAVALDYFSAASEAAATANSFQERARALSRIGTTLADHGYYGDAASLLPRAIAQAQQEETQAMQDYSFYEIAGSAAFIGDFDTASEIVARLPETPLGSATSLKAVTQRDVAWGLARHGRLEDSVNLARSISSPRERAHALCRIVRLMHDEEMKALPRYL